MNNYFKNKSKLILFLFSAAMISLISCEEESENDQIPTVDSSECLSPSGLNIEVIAEDFFGDTVELTWNPEGDEAQWEVKLAAGTFNRAKTFIADTPKIKIKEVLDSENAVFTISAVCGEDITSEAVTFPSLDVFSGPATASMSAIIDGVSYNGMKPAGFGFFGTATSITESSVHDGIHLWIQGGTRIGTEISGVEINLYINKNHWSTGAYELKGGNNYETLDEEVDTYATFFNLDSPYRFDVEEIGALVITKFDISERVIEGTFSFSYSKYDRNTDELIATEKIESGTFQYSLDDEYFD